MLPLPVHCPPGGCRGEDPSGPSTRLCEGTGLWGGGTRARGGVSFLGGWPRACETVTTPRASWCRLCVVIVKGETSSPLPVGFTFVKFCMLQCEKLFA